MSPRDFLGIPRDSWAPWESPQNCIYCQHMVAAGALDCPADIALITYFDSTLLVEKQTGMKFPGNLYCLGSIFREGSVRILVVSPFEIE